MGNATILVTGMSGVGKSAALTELTRCGFETVDTDYGPWIDRIDDEPLWREPLIEELLNRPRARHLFVQGTVANQGRFYDRFDAVVLLSAPVGVVLDRLSRRTNNPFGKTESEREQVMHDIADVEPLLREAATHEIDTASRSLHDVVEELAAIAAAVAPPQR